MQQKPKIQLTEEQRQEAKVLAVQAMRRTKLRAAAEEKKKLADNNQNPKE